MQLFTVTARVRYEYRYDETDTTDSVVTLLINAQSEAQAREAVEAYYLQRCSGPDGYEETDLTDPTNYAHSYQVAVLSVNRVLDATAILAGPRRGGC